MNIDSDDWQVVGNTVYKLFADEAGHRCNEFTIQISGDREVNPKELDKLAEEIATKLNREVLPL